MLVDKDSHLPGQDRTETKLKPSQAMRIGIALRPVKCVENFFAGDNASCALGAMWQGYGYPGEPPSFMSDWGERLTGLTVEMAISVFTRNDAGWTREQIAQWLEEQGY